MQETEAGMGRTPWGKTSFLKDLSRGTFLLECGENINLPDFNFCLSLIRFPETSVKYSLSRRGPF